MARKVRLQEQGAYKGWLTGLALVALIGFSMVSLGTAWHWDGVNFISIRSGNFAPLVKPGDAVVTKPIRVSELALGDMIGYRNPLNSAETKAGQIQAIDAKAGTVTFDWNGNAGSKDVDDSLLIGKVGYRLSHAGYLLDFVHSRWGLVLAVYLPSMLILGQEIRNLSGSYRGRIVYRLYGSAH